MRKLLRNKNNYDVLVVEINNICNLHCHQCVYDKMKNLPHEMSCEEFLLVLDSAIKFGIKKIRILGLAEPTLHSHIDKIINCIKQYPEFEYHILSNGTTLYLDTVFNALKESEIDLIEFSLDAFTDNTYGLVRNDAFSLRQITSNIIRLKESIDTFSRVKIGVSFVMHPETICELDDFKSFWERKVDKIILREPHNFSNNVCYLPSQKHHAEHAEQCDFVRHKIYIDCFMNVHLCKMDFDNEILIGKLDLEHDLSSIMDSDLCNELLNGNCERLSSLCANCSGCD